MSSAGFGANYDFDRQTIPTNNVDYETNRYAGKGVRQVTFKQDPRLLIWAGEVLGVTMCTPHARTVSHLLQHDDGTHEILAVVVLDKWTEFSCEASIASDGSARWASRTFLAGCYEFVFGHAGKTRINMPARVTNEKAIRMHYALGHHSVGILRDQFGEGQDGLLFGFTKKNYLASKWHKSKQIRETIQ